jgi:antitoxin FitA
MALKEIGKSSMIFIDAMAGRSLSDYVLTEIKEIVERPTLAEMRKRLHRRKPIAAEFDSARLVREERGAR